MLNSYEEILQIFNKVIQSEQDNIQYLTDLKELWTLRLKFMEEEIHASNNELTSIEQCIQITTKQIGILEKIIIHAKHLDHVNLSPEIDVQAVINRYDPNIKIKHIKTRVPHEQEKSQLKMRLETLKKDHAVARNKLISLNETYLLASNNLMLIGLALIHARENIRLCQVQIDKINRNRLAQSVTEDDLKLDFTELSTTIPQSGLSALPQSAGLKNSSSSMFDISSMDPDPSNEAQSVDLKKSLLSPQPGPITSTEFSSVFKLSSALPPPPEKKTKNVRLEVMTTFPATPQSQKNLRDDSLVYRPTRAKTGTTEQKKYCLSQKPHTPIPPKQTLYSAGGEDLFIKDKESGEFRKVVLISALNREEKQGISNYTKRKSSDLTYSSSSSSSSPLPKKSLSVSGSRDTFFTSPPFSGLKALSNPAKTPSKAP